MKVGTDGVLLGAWTSLEQRPDAILDIGAGTGIIGLMLAQRSLATTIDAIEIDAKAYEQCVENFEASRWADRLFCYHASLVEFTAEMEDEYDLIVSNPPFYTEDNSTSNASRARARQNFYLPFDELIAGVVSLLSPSGVFSTIIPFAQEKSFIRLAASKFLFPRKITRVRGNSKTAIKRSLLIFERQEKEVEYNEMTIEISRHVYTEEYIALTKDFYLKM